MNKRIVLPSELIQNFGQTFFFTFQVEKINVHKLDFWSKIYVKIKYSTFKFKCDYLLLAYLYSIAPANFKDLLSKINKLV